MLFSESGTGLVCRMLLTLSRLSPASISSFDRLESSSVYFSIQGHEPSGLPIRERIRLQKRVRSSYRGNAGKDGKAMIAPTPIILRLKAIA